MSKLDQLTADLHYVSKSCYLVSDKRPPSYDRRWHLYVLWPDGKSETFSCRDSENYERLYLDALRMAQYHQKKEGC